jgi:hypothetical protein
VIFEAGKTPPLPGFAPCESLSSKTDKRIILGHFDRVFPLRNSSSSRTPK